MPIFAKKWPPHRDRPEKRPAALINSPVLYPFPQYLVLKKPTAGNRYHICLFCGHESFHETQRKFLLHAITRIIRPGSTRYMSGLERYLACWELANKPDVDYVIEGVGA